MSQFVSTGQFGSFDGKLDRIERYRLGFRRDLLYTPHRYLGKVIIITKTATDKKINRLRRIEGQVRGIAQMIDDDRYCIDILHQVQAVKSALARVESEILKDHAACCVQEAIASGDAQEQKVKFDELVELFDKVKR